MKISVFGLGYVGTVSAGCLGRDGHSVIGVDPNVNKVDMINHGKAPIIEREIDAIIRDGADEQRVKATTDVRYAVHHSDISLVCVGTPSQLNGSLDLRYVRRVCEEIGLALKEKSDYHVVVIRSTMLPGTMRDIVIPVLEESSRKEAGAAFGVCIHPEFLREGTAVHDYYHPPKTVIGELDVRSGDAAADLCSALDAPMIRTSIEIAEMVKYADNAWHALKVTFANEIGNIGKALGIDSFKVMDIFCQDTKLNLSPYYLRPGFAFGGSCLPKDVRALTYKARSLDLDLPLLNSILPSNERQIDRAVKKIISKGKRRIGFLGFSFKAGTDDLRESPLVETIERLLGKGYDIRIYDRYVKLATLVGANREYILNHIPHVSRLMVEDVNDILLHAEVIVIGTNDPDFVPIVADIRAEQIIVDFVRLVDPKQVQGKYDGICW